MLELETRLGMGNTRISSDNCFLFLLILYKGESSNFKVKFLKIAILSSSYFNISEKASSMKNRICLNFLHCALGRGLLLTVMHRLNSLLGLN